MPNTALEDVTRVAVGLLVVRDRVFVTRRPDDGRHLGGKWEFPGGKLRPGEGVREALARELVEELGIEVLAAEPWMKVRHRYPDRTVLLEVWRVLRWRGEPHGREGQAARWVPCTELPTLEFPEADLPILRRLWLPPLYLITDSRRFATSEAFLAALERLLGEEGGVRLVQLREPHLGERDYAALAGRVAALCRRYGAVLMLNAPPETVARIELPPALGGVHLTSRRLMALPAGRPLPPPYWVAASCHDAAQLAQAERCGADFVVLGPVAPTASHPDAVPLGWERFRALRATTGLPVYALGGMRPADLGRARAAGARGLAMIGAVWDAADPCQAARAVIAAAQPCADAAMAE
jgi:8-oxo-dGTP diphosphatase